ncbi:MAG: GAF domain-containing protein [Ardenticatenaceae bacterium]|nr:GAF domain-containing protein [Ardenticatenaceae bacterium]
MIDHRLAEAAFWSFLTNINDGVVLLDETGSVIHINPRAQELLQIYYPVNHLLEIFQAVEPDGAWSRWQELLNPPHALLINTDSGDIYVAAKPVVWEEQRIVQLIMNGSTHIDRPLEEQSREELMSEIGYLRERSSQLARHARQAELLNILAEASAVMANSEDARSILTHLGENLLRLVEGVGVALYRWSDDGKLVEMMVDIGRQINLEPSFDLGEFPLENYSVLSQLRNEQSLLMCEGAAYIPGPPSWSHLGIKHTIMLLPILSGSEPYGAVALGLTNKDSDPNEDELQILFTLLNQASGALERVRLFENIRERERFLAGLNRVGGAINGTLDLARVLNLICRESMNIFGLDGVYIWQKPHQSENETPYMVGLASEGHSSEAFVGLQLDQEERQLFAHQIVEKGQSKFINRFQEASNVEIKLPGSEAIQAVLGTPLLYHDRPLGVLVMVDCTRPDRFTEQDVERINTFAVQAATALHNAQMVTRLRDLNEDLDQRVVDRTRDLGQERDRVHWLLQINNELTATLDEDRVLTRGLELVNEVVQATQGLILLFDEATGGFVVRAELIGAETESQKENTYLQQIDALASWVVDCRQGLILHDLNEDERWSQFAKQSSFYSTMGIPLIFSGEVIGVMMLFHQQADAFTDQQLRMIEAAGSYVAHAIYNAHLFVLIRNQAERLGKMLRTEQVNAAKTQAMLESIADGVLVVNEQGTVLLANDAFVNMFNVKHKRILNRPLTELSGLYGQSGDHWLKTIQDWQVLNSRIDSHDSLEATIELSDRKITVRYHLAPIFVGGRFFGTVTIFRDITKNVEVDRMKTEFVSTVSHELRTPLTVIKGYLDLLLMGAFGSLDDNVAHYLDIVKNNTDRLQELVDDLLDISRIEAGRMKLDFQQVDLVTIIESVVGVHLQNRIQQEGKPMKTSIKVGEDLALVDVDPTRIQQVLTHLIDNAFNYTSENGHITIEAFNEGSAVCVRVMDTGIGIEPDHREKIFDRFFRSDTDPVQKIAGTGLGLPIVRSLIEMHGGSIEVFSEPGRGSEFRFTLPCSGQNATGEELNG